MRSNCREEAEKLAHDGWLTLGKTEPELVDMIEQALIAAEVRGMRRAAEIAGRHRVQHISIPEPWQHVFEWDQPAADAVDEVAGMIAKAIEQAIGEME